MSELQTIFGGREIEIRLADGTTDKVKVRQLPIRLLGQYADLHTDEPALVELLVGKPDGFADNLAIESYEEIIAVGKELNDGPFERWVNRQAAAVKNTLRTLEIITSASAKSAQPSAPAVDTPPKV